MTATSIERTAATADADLSAAFARDGFVIIHGLFAPEAVDRCADALAGLREAHPELDVPPDAPARERFRAMIALTERSGALPDVQAVALHAGARDVLHAIFGQPPVARYTRLLSQSPGALPPNAERRGTPHLHNFGMATVPPGGRAIVWTPVDDVRPQAGPMWILPGSHLEFASFPDRLLDAVPGAREELHRMWVYGASAERWLAWHGAIGDRSMTILADWMDAEGAKPMPILLQRGDALVFSNDLLHGTLPAQDPRISRRIMFTHYHAAGRQLWEIGDAVGTDVNAMGPGFYERSDDAAADPAHQDLGGFGRFYESMKGFFEII